MDADTIIHQSQNGDITTKDTVVSNSIDNTCNYSGETNLSCNDSNGSNGIGEINVESLGCEGKNTVLTGSNGMDTTQAPRSDQQERVPKIYVCPENHETDNSVDDDVPSECVSSNVNGEPQVGNGKGCDGNTDQNEKQAREEGEKEIDTEPLKDNNTKFQTDTDDVDPNTKANAGECHQNKHRTNNSNEEEQITPLPTRTSQEQDLDEEAAVSKSNELLSSPSSSSSTSSNHQQPSASTSSSTTSSKFSFFRSIQNIIIATKWSKLRNHGSSKSSQKQNQNEPSGSGENPQQQQQLQKPERQRKISQRSQPGDLLRNDSNEKDNETNHQAREGLDLLDSTSRNAKDKGTSPSKSHFSLFKRHNNNADSERTQSPPTPPPAELTERQKVLLRSSWAEIGDSVGQVGVIAFIGLFETHPDVKDMFNEFRGMTMESVFTSISLKEHALRVMTTVEKFLNRIDRPDKLQKILEDLGKRHVAYHFKTEYINVVGMQFIFAMRPHVNSWTPETEQAWTALVHTMTYHMEQGALVEMQKQSTC